MKSLVENPRKKEIEEILLIVAGNEIFLRQALRERDYEFAAILKKSQKNYYERLRKIAYGLDPGGEEPKQES